MHSFRGRGRRLTPVVVKRDRYEDQFYFDNYAHHKAQKQMLEDRGRVEFFRKIIKMKKHLFEVQLKSIEQNKTQ